MLLRVQEVAGTRRLALQTSLILLRDTLSTRALSSVSPFRAGLASDAHECLLTWDEACRREGNTCVA